jgi:saccharopine dehydrogenase-like NADP-dependent oxidoreductase
MKRVVLLGAGLVSRPLVAQLARWPDIALTVGDLDREKAAHVLGGEERGRALAVSMDDDARVASLVAEADLVVSLLPYTLHVKVARVAIAHRVPLITTSYVSAEMSALDEAARAAGVLILNEIGLDPGLDHMSAMRMIRQLADEGSRLVSFRSCCGGLPAPDANTNPWGYKFSWSHGRAGRGLNAARWLEDGGSSTCRGRLFTRAARRRRRGSPEVYPNRMSSTSRASIEAFAMFRGTLHTVRDSAAVPGLLDTELAGEWPTCRARKRADAYSAIGALQAPAGIDPGGAVAERLRWAGLFSDRPLPSPKGAPIDMLCARLAECLAYEADERDMIVLRHEFGVVDREGRDASRASTLVAFGDPGGDTAMARTVSLPAAVAARLILDGRVASTGVRIPVDPEIYDPVLEALEPMGIVFRETRSTP